MLAYRFVLSPVAFVNGLGVKKPSGLLGTYGSVDSIFYQTCEGNLVKQALFVLTDDYNYMTHPR